MGSYEFAPSELHHGPFVRLFARLFLVLFPELVKSMVIIVTHRPKGTLVGFVSDELDRSGAHNDFHHYF